MIIAILQNNVILRKHISYSDGSNYIIHDTKENVLGNIVFTGSKCMFYANTNISITNSNNESVTEIEVKEYSVLNINNTVTKEVIQLYFYLSYVPNTTELEIKKNSINVGKGTDCDLVYNSPYMKNHQYKLTYQKESWYLESLDGFVYVNDKLVKRKRVDHGDIIFSNGLKVVPVGNTLVVSNLLANTKLVPNSDAFATKKRVVQKAASDAMDREGESEVFSPDDEFLRSPRFRTQNEMVEIGLVPPPQENAQQITPTILTIGPQMTMVVTSVVTMSQTIMTAMTNNTDFKTVMLSVGLSLFTMVSSFLWPALTRRYTKVQERKNKALRFKKYKNYLEEKEKEINDIVESQKQVMIENNVSLEMCQQIIYGRKRNLWEKTINDNDFLTARVGTGYVPPLINLNYNEAEYSTEDTVLTREVKALINKYRFIPDMPLETSFLYNRISAIIGNPGLLKSFFESLLLQIMTFHIYSELKIVIFTNEKNQSNWEWMKFSPYCWDNQHEVRYIAATIDDKKKLSQYIDSVIKSRMESIGDSDAGDQYRMFEPYFLIITDDIEQTRNLDGIKSVLEMPVNVGFSMIIKHNRIANLPSQCSTFIHIAEDKSGLFKNDLSAANQSQFQADFNKTINVEECVKELANIYVNIPLDKHELPKSVGFLDMYGVGNVQQLNSLDRWHMNNPVNSLAVPVGIDQQGELFNMDIHENAYGPHGLVAGTTGSGKSEWIITYILSLCVNFSPEEVQFVLIDYKGGGLAGSFDNKETGMHLPHLVGTITNLDKSEIRRSLASLEAESKRRQQMFNEAREKLNDSSMNIYKYQQYYRKGMLDEPLSHLLIISDEFAELKSQEPEFLDQLVSIARIGRSLGIHLILATQKPAGVVDEQMWSNSRFKICLRVQDKADSKDMIKCDDAAYLKQTGAFYLQVGMNEFFALGQSAYSGGKYQPTSIVKKKIATSVELLNDLGEVINSVEYIKPQENDEKNQKVHGEELLNIILYVSDISKNQNFKIRPLWLDPIPETIYVDNLKKKYEFNRVPFIVDPIIGEYDNPYQQKQALLQLNLNNGNTYITGVSGSGKEQLLQSMIYSIISSYTPQEVSLYIMDFGAETLGMYEGAPHVGGVVYQNNIDMIENAFRFAQREYVDRRKRYREYGGTYDSYIKYSETKDPLMVFIINNVDNLKEMLPEQIDNMLPLFKECAKYGIIFVCSSVDKNAIKGKVLDTFPQKIALKQSDDDFSQFFGNKSKGIFIKDFKGRGLMEINNACFEFQAASVYQEDKLQQIVKQICEQLVGYYKNKAVPIPMIPRTLNMNTINTKGLSFNKICVGYGKNTIEPIYFDLQRNFGTLIIAPKKYVLTEYTKVLYQELESICNKDDKRVYLFDPNDMLKAERYTNITYVESSEIVNTFNNLCIYINDEYNKYSSTEDKKGYTTPRRSIIIFHEASQIIKLLDSEFERFNEIVDKSRELGLFDFVFADMMADYKDVSRDKALQKLFMDSNGVLLANTYEAQTFVELNSRDIKLKDSLDENMGYIVENGRGYYSQMLQFTDIKEDTEDEV